MLYPYKLRAIHIYFTLHKTQYIRNLFTGKVKMGIHGLTKLLADNAPSAMKENEMKNYFGELTFFI